MPIRMMEWGMMHAPADAAHVPVQGMVGWNATARQMGEGVSGMLNATAALVQGQERVQKAGELAAFSERLQAIDAETRAELADCDVQDWDYAWRAACEPRLNEAVAELPPSARQAGMDLAKAYSARACMEAYRDRSLQSLHKAREQWQQQLDAAVEQGDEENARRYLQEGKDIFIPPDAQAAREKQVTSAARLARWKRGLEEDPLKTLSSWGGAGDGELPEGEEERRSLRSLVARKRTEMGTALAERVGADLEQGEEAPASLWERAHRAGLISDAQLQNAQAAPRPLAPVERCQWFRRMDEMEDDDAQRRKLQMDILTAPLPRKERLELLRRFKNTNDVALADRRTLSCHLWNLYQRGAFGCPGDSMACKRMAQLQQQGLQLLAEQGVDAAAAWAGEQRGTADRWVCFSDSHPTA